MTNTMECRRQDIASADTSEDGVATHGAANLHVQSMCTEILSKNLPEQRYNVRQKLGKGGFGNVYSGKKKDKFDGTASPIVAIKAVDYKPRETKCYEAEMGTLMALDHPNIVKFLEGYRHGKKLYIVLEFINGVTIYEASKTLFQRGVWAEDNVKGLNITGVIFQQCFSALEHLHQRGFIHRDIKDQNILVDTHGRVKLVDFGLVTSISARLQDRSGTIKYMAPEVKAKTGICGTPADIWSVGVTLMIFTFGETPRRLSKDYNPTNVARLLNSIKQRIPEVVFEVIQRCLRPEAENRPTATDLLQTDLMNYSCPLQQVGDIVKDKLGLPPSLPAKKG